RRRRRRAGRVRSYGSHGQRGFRVGVEPWWERDVQSGTQRRGERGPGKCDGIGVLTRPPRKTTRVRPRIVALLALVHNSTIPPEMDKLGGYPDLYRIAIQRRRDHGNRIRTPRARYSPNA